MGLRVACVFLFVAMLTWQPLYGAPPGANTDGEESKTLVGAFSKLTRDLVAPVIGAATPKSANGEPTAGTQADIAQSGNSRGLNTADADPERQEQAGETPSLSAGGSGMLKSHSESAVPAESGDDVSRPSQGADVELEDPESELESTETQWEKQADKVEQSIDSLVRETTKDLVDSNSTVPARVASHHGDDDEEQDAMPLAGQPDQTDDQTPPPAQRSPRPHRASKGGNLDEASLDTLPRHNEEGLKPPEDMDTKVAATDSASENPLSDLAGQAIIVMDTGRSTRHIAKFNNTNSASHTRRHVTIDKTAIDGQIELELTASELGLVPGPRGWSCEAVCEAANSVCRRNQWVHVNSCDDVSLAFECPSGCETSPLALQAPAVVWGWRSMEKDLSFQLAGGDGQQHNDSMAESHASPTSAGGNAKQLASMLQEDMDHALPSNWSKMDAVCLVRSTKEAEAAEEMFRAHETDVGTSIRDTDDPVSEASSKSTKQDSAGRHLESGQASSSPPTSSASASNSSASASTSSASASTSSSSSLTGSSRRGRSLASAPAALAKALPPSFRCDAALPNARRLCPCGRLSPLERENLLLRRSVNQAREERLAALTSLKAVQKEVKGMLMGYRYSQEELREKTAELVEQEEEDAMVARAQVLIDALSAIDYATGLVKLPDGTTMKFQEANTEAQRLFVDVSTRARERDEIRRAALVQDEQDRQAAEAEAEIHKQEEADKVQPTAQASPLSGATSLQASPEANNDGINTTMRDQSASATCSPSPASTAVGDSGAGADVSVSPSLSAATTASITPTNAPVPPQQQPPSPKTDTRKPINPRPSPSTPKHPGTATGRTGGGGGGGGGGTSPVDLLLDGTGSSHKHDPAILSYNPVLLQDIASLLCAASVGGMAAALLGVPPSFGYLLGGALAGPSGLGLVSDLEHVGTVAQFGVVFPLFANGLQFQLKDHARFHRQAAITALVLSVSLTMLFSLLGPVLGLVEVSSEGLLIGLAASLCSPGVAIANLLRSGHLTHTAGQIGTGVLAVQDLVMGLLLSLPHALGPYLAASSGQASTITGTAAAAARAGGGGSPPSIVAHLHPRAGRGSVNTPLVSTGGATSGGATTGGVAGAIVRSATASSFSLLSWLWASADGEDIATGLQAPVEQFNQTPTASLGRRLTTASLASTTTTGTSSTPSDPSSVAGTAAQVGASSSASSDSVSAVALAASALLKSAAAFGMVVLVTALVSRRIVPSIVDYFGREGQQRDVHLLVLVSLCMMMGVATEAAGLSLEMGAFFAGLMVSGAKDIGKVMQAVEPLSQVFSGMFFASIGLVISPAYVLTRAPTIMSNLVTIFAVKSVVLFATSRYLGFSHRNSLITALSLAQVSEYSLIFTGKAHAIGLLGRASYLEWMTSTIAALVTSPLLARLLPILLPLLPRQRGDTDAAAVSDSSSFSRGREAGATAHTPSARDHADSADDSGSSSAPEGVTGTGFRDGQQPLSVRRGETASASSDQQHDLDEGNTSEDQAEVRMRGPRTSRARILSTPETRTAESASVGQGGGTSTSPIAGSRVSTGWRDDGLIDDEFDADTAAGGATPASRRERGGSEAAGPTTQQRAVLLAGMSHTARQTREPGNLTTNLFSTSSSSGSSHDGTTHSHAV